jgi:hypothetical protein
MYYEYNGEKGKEPRDVIAEAESMMMREHVRMPLESTIVL